MESDRRRCQEDSRVDGPDRAYEGRRRPVSGSGRDESRALARLRDLARPRSRIGRRGGLHRCFRLVWAEQHHRRHRPRFRARSRGGPSYHRRRAGESGRTQQPLSALDRRSDRHVDHGDDPDGTTRARNEPDLRNREGPPIRREVPASARPRGQCRHRDRDGVRVPRLRPRARGRARQSPHLLDGRKVADRDRTRRGRTGAALQVGASSQAARMAVARVRGGRFRSDVDALHCRACPRVRALHDIRANLRPARGDRRAAALDVLLGARDSLRRCGCSAARSRQGRRACGAAIPRRAKTRKPCRAWLDRRRRNTPARSRVARGRLAGEGGAELRLSRRRRARRGASPTLRAHHPSPSSATGCSTRRHGEPMPETRRACTPVPCC